MITIAEVRAAGGTIALSPSGGLDLVCSDPQLVAEVREGRKDIVARLRREALEGERYEDSALYIRLDAMYCAARAFEAQGVAVKEAARLLEVIAEVNDAAYESAEALSAVVNKHRDEVFAIVERMAAAAGLLSGRELHATAKRVFAPQLDAEAFA